MIDDNNLRILSKSRNQSPLSFLFVHHHMQKHAERHRPHLKILFSLVCRVVVFEFRLEVFVSAH